MVTTEAKGRKLVVERGNNQILVPEYKTLLNTFYADGGLDNGGSEVEEEEEEEERYVSMHRPYELAESCGNFLNEGQGLPEEFKGGLTVRLKLH